MNLSLNPNSKMSSQQQKVSVFLIIVAIIGTGKGRAKKKVVGTKGTKGNHLINIATPKPPSKTAKAKGKEPLPPAKSNCVC
jgi:hypothetical protein